MVQLHGPLDDGNEFSLRRQKGSRIFHVRGFEVRDIDGEMIGGGIRCEPLPNDEGRDLHSCEGIIRRASNLVPGD